MRARGHDGGPLFWAASFAISLGAWFLFVGTFGWNELVAGAIASGLAATAAQIVWSQHVAGFRGNLRWVLEAWRLRGVRWPVRRAVPLAAAVFGGATPSTVRQSWNALCATLAGMRLHLVDGTYELFRAYYSKRPSHRAPDGSDKKATLALASAMLALLHDEGEAVTHVAVAFDNPIRSFRNELFDGYKTDDGVPPELLAQFDSAEEAVRALGMAVWSMREFEADDALATGAARFGAEVEQVRILTPDKDLGQCLRGMHVVQVDWRAKTVVDEEALLRRRGVRPESVPDLLALTGDDADGIPGLPGFGEKSAAALLAEFIHLEHIPADARAWPPVRQAPRLAATLQLHREAALLYRRLATLRTDAPIGTLEDAQFRGVPRDRFFAWCDALGANELRGRPRRWA